jgi:malto-oligosyltrehalose trehalohydrolase
MQYAFGPLIDDTGIRFRLWAPSQSHVDLLLPDRAPLAMQRADDGFWNVHVEGVAAGTRYRFRANGHDFADPASRRQERDVTGWSVVWPGLGRTPRPSPLRPWYETILCEVHVGTASPEGTFLGLADRLEHFRDAGYTALELMPISDFPGQRGWGYDGVLPFAPDGAYGTPEDLRRLVDRAHELGIGMVLDVVYNHFGTVGNTIPLYAPEWFADDVETPWGPGVDFRQAAVRRFYCENAQWWLGELDFDGLRFDSVHEMHTEARDLFLGELARACRKVKPDAALVIENVTNQMHWLTRTGDGRPVDFTAQWNDDFHHVLQFLVTGERIGGYEDERRDPVADLEKSLADGFVHDGDADGNSDGRTRNEPASALPMQAFVSFLHNHDQIGNRPDGQRIVERVDAERLDFAHFVLLLSPQIPLFFMGEEAHLRGPFLFFFDLPEPQQSELRDNRYWQMENVFHTEVEPGSLPDPQDVETFERSKLDWQAYGERQHREALDRFKELVELRRDLVWPLATSKCLESRSARQGNGVIVTWAYEAGTYTMMLNPTGEMTTMEVELNQPVASTGRFEFHNGRIRVWPWSALVWRS